MPHPPSAVRMLRAAVAATVLLVCGCTSSGVVPTPSPPAAPAPAAPAPAPTYGVPDLRKLVIPADEIPLPGFLPPTVQPVGADEIDGVEAFFESADGSRQMGETIVLLPDADAARTAVQGAAATIQDQRPGSTASAAQVGDGAVVVTGSEVDGTASTLLLFSQGAASVVMDFRGPASDPPPAEQVIDAGTRQAALLMAAHI